MFKVKYVDSIMMLVRLELNLIVSLFQHKYEVSETVSTTTLMDLLINPNPRVQNRIQNGGFGTVRVNMNCNRWRTMVANLLEGDVT